MRAMTDNARPSVNARRNARVLLVHDDLGVGNAVALACAARAIDVVLAQSIPDALLALERIVFELLVLDLWVSDERGERAIEYLEFIPACPRVVIWSDSIDTLDLDSLCV